MNLEKKKRYYCHDCGGYNHGEDWDKVVYSKVGQVMFECPVCNEIWSFTDLEDDLPENVVKISEFLPFCCGGNG